MKTLNKDGSRSYLNTKTRIEWIYFFNRIQMNLNLAIEDLNQNCYRGYGESS